VEVVMATETRSKVFDPERWEVIEEVLLMSDVRLPDDGRIPLTVEHERHAGAVIGSVVDMRVEGKKLVGRAVFSRSADTEPYYVKVVEGHLNRFSVVYPADTRRTVWIDGGKEKKVNGKVYKGPVAVTKSWEPKSLGLVLYAADRNAKARGAAPTTTTPSTKERAMDERLRKYLERMGLDPEADEDAAWAYLDELSARSEPDDPPAHPNEPAEPPPDPDPDTIRKNAEIAAAEAVRAERERVAEIHAMGRAHGLEEAADEMVRNGVDIEKARKKFLELLKKRTDGVGGDGYRAPITISADAHDKFRGAAMDAIMLRSGLEVETPAAGADELRGYSLQEMARESLRVAGRPTGGQPLEMIGRALNTDDLPYILANVANKSLFTGWETAEETWSQWCGTGTVSDFKTHYSPRLSEADDLDQVLESQPYKYGTRTEEQETYSVATYGKLFALTRQTIINDDLGALTRIPASHGEAAARKIGDVAYAVLTANAAMGDGVALFNSAHSNVGTGGAPSETTLAEGVKLMKLQKDVRDLRRLNIRPRFFIGPVALEGSAEKFFASEYLDVTSGSMQRNIYGGNYFTRIYEPRLDDDSSTKWYLAAAKGKTVTVFFLNGQQRPYLETKQGWSVDGVEYKVRIDCGAKAMDWRGLVYNAGA